MSDKRMTDGQIVHGEASKGMSDAEIERYIFEIRKWPRRPSDYGPTTESIIRRYLRGEIEIGTPSGGGGPAAEPTAVGTPAPKGAAGSTVAGNEYDPVADSLGSYDTALEALRNR